MDWEALRYAAIYLMLSVLFYEVYFIGQKLNRAMKLLCYCMAITSALWTITATLKLLAALRAFFQ